MKGYRTIDDLDAAGLKGKRILLRVDLNVPLDKGRVTDATRIERVLPTIRELTGKGAKVILLSHMGRPRGGPDRENSLRPVHEWLQAHYGPAAFATDCIGVKAELAVAAMQPGEVLLLENTRFHKGEEMNDPAFVSALARLGDIYVNDAFSCAHRAHASTEGIAHRMPACAGRAMQVELNALTRALEAPERPLAAIVGGAKISTKLDLLGNLLTRVNILIIGGAMANTFLAARGKSVGKSLVETDLLATAREIMDKAAAIGREIVLPIDVVLSKKFEANAPSRTAGTDDVSDSEMILDIGPRSAETVIAALRRARTLVWNGPFGAFELKPFDNGTNLVARAAAELTRAGKLLTLGGGGDTVAALNAAGVTDDFSYVSTAGGAFLEWMEGKTLPGLEVLRAK